MLSMSYPHTVFVKVDVDKIQLLSMRFGISSMPTFVFIRNGQELSRFSGASAEKIEQMIIQFGGDKSVSFWSLNYWCSKEQFSKIIEHVIELNHSHLDSLKVLCSILKNIINRPKEEKFRKIMLSNAKLMKVLNAPGSLFILEQAGFKKDEKLNCIQMPMDTDISKVKEIYNKIIETQEEEGKPIYFYSEEDPKYGCFSIFSPHGFVIDSKRYPTVEHCMHLF